MAHTEGECNKMRVSRYIMPWSCTVLFQPFQSHEIWLSHAQPNASVADSKPRAVDERWNIHVDLACLCNRSFPT